MFFTQDLLSRRDSGFGLLWLAATLGSKSAVKKLPRRQIQTIDISQLCHLISEPNEPLALRLSSNLLVGVVRVYKVKQELFMNDVNNCFVSLKKIVQELHFPTVTDSRLELPHSSVRPSAVTLVSDGQNTLSVDFDALVADWDEYLNLNGNGEFDPTQRNRLLQTAVGPVLSAAQTHTLEETHNHLLSVSADLSLIGTGLDGSLSSHNENFDFSFHDQDPVMIPSDDLDVSLLADELARELGWEECILEKQPGARHDSEQPGDICSLPGMDIDELPLPELPDNSLSEVDHVVSSSAGIKRKADRFEDDALDIPASLDDNHRQPGGTQAVRDHAIAAHPTLKPNRREDIPDKAAYKRPKTTRLLLDVRTELTDDELKAARASYLEGQEELKRGLRFKEHGQIHGRRLAELVGSAPEWIRTPVLANFWNEVYKLQVEARSAVVGLRRFDTEPAKKRRRTEGDSPEPLILDIDTFPQEYFEIGECDAFYPNNTRMRSSEEPGQGRRDSHTPNVAREIDVALDLRGRDIGSGSQKSSLFPWDNAGISSSITGGFDGFIASDPHIIDADVRMRSSSNRDSPIHSGGFGNIVGYSPIPLRRRSQSIGEEYIFEGMDGERSAASEAQHSDTNLLTLERSSYNFLEYVKMQSRSLPSGGADLTFDIVVPQLTSTRHVAASAFYHCLVLVTKDLLHVEQKEAYGPMVIKIS